MMTVARTDTERVVVAIDGPPAAIWQPKVIAPLVEQHADGAAAAWLRRDQAVDSFDYSLRELAELDERLDAHLQGLRCAGDAGRLACDRLLADACPGDLFAPTVLALEARDAGRVERLLAIAEGVPVLARSLLSAFGWVSPRCLQGIVARWLAGPSAFVRLVGLASCALHRVSPGLALVMGCVDNAPEVRARAFRTVGEIGAVALRPELRAALTHTQADEVFEAAWALVMLGDREEGLDRLVALSLQAGTRQLRALQTVLPALDMAEVRAVLRELAATAPDPRLLLMAVGISGDTHYVPWLIAQMEHPSAAPFAGEAFSTITGAELVREHLTRVPGTAADEDLTAASALEVARPPLCAGEAYLARPDAQKAAAWWAAQHHLHACPGTLMQGLPVGAAVCMGVLRQGGQQRRIAAALRLRALSAQAPLFDCRAPAWRQVRALNAA